MSFAEETTLKPVTLTQAAAEAVKEVMANKNLNGYALRLFVSGGGCSGFQYGLALDNRTRDEDMITETEGIRLLVDEVSIQYLQGASVDYVNDETNNGFKIINPNPVPSCGCGQSSDTEAEASSSNCAGCG